MNLRYLIVAFNKNGLKFLQGFQNLVGMFLEA